MRVPTDAAPGAPTVVWRGSITGSPSPPGNAIAMDASGTRLVIAVAVAWADDQAERRSLPDARHEQAVEPAIRTRHRSEVASDVLMVTADNHG